VSSLRSEWMRKGVHISMGGFALFLRWLSPWQAAGCALLALLFNLIVLHRLTGRRLLRQHERNSGYSLGIALYPAMVLLAILVFRERLELAAAVWGLLAIGDGMATVAGKLSSGGTLPWNRQKSWAGWLAFVINGTAASAFLIRWTQQAALDGSAAADHVGLSFLVAGGEQREFLFLVIGCFVATLLTATVESLQTGIDDNILVPLFGGAALYAATMVEPSRLLDSSTTLLNAALWGLAINGLLALLAYAAKSVNRAGAVSGVLLGTALFAFGSWRMFLIFFLFFVVATVTTKIGYRKKMALGVAQSRGGRRGVENAVANTLTGVLFAFLAVATSWTLPFTAAAVAAFATAACDTVSSEIGQAFGRRHLLITTLKRVPPGTDGAVSLEGTLAGLLASILLAVVAERLTLLTPLAASIVAAAGFAGATIESYLGATLERANQLNNELVNFANTLIGALLAMIAVAIWAV